MSIKQKWIFFAAFWHLAGALLPAGLAYADAEATAYFAPPAERPLPETDHVGAFHAVDQNDHRSSPHLPEELPCPGTDGKKENTGKDTFEDDASAHPDLFQPFSASLCLSASAYHPALSAGQHDVPLYVLFHCWKNFLI